MMHSSVSPSYDFRSITKASVLLGSTVENAKITRSERSYYCYMPMFCIVWLLRNLSLGGKLCLRDDKNTAFV